METPKITTDPCAPDPAREVAVEVVGHRETKLLRFVEAYLDRGNATDAARQLGYEGHTASNIGWRFLHDPFVQERLGQYFSKHSQDREIARREITAGLYREANDFSQGANSMTRIRAWEVLAKLKGLDRDEPEHEEADSTPLTAEEIRLLREEFEERY